MGSSVSKIQSARIVLAFTAIAIATVRTDACVGLPDDPVPRGPDKAAVPVGIPIIVGSPADLENLWKRLGRPDFVIRRGDDVAGNVATQTREPGAVVASVAVVGEVRGDLASLKVSYRIMARGDGPIWATIGLNRIAVTDAREGQAVADLRMAEGGAWQVEVAGVGEHRVTIDAIVPVKAAAEGRRIEVGIVEAASTSLSLAIPGRIVSAESGPAEPVDAKPVPGRAATMLEARLSARARVSLSWQAEAEAGPDLAPLLDARGEVAADLDGATFRTRSNWLIAAVRGSAPSLTVALDPADELVDLSLDGQAMDLQGLRSDDRLSATIPLPAPLRPGSPARVMLATRRALADAPRENATRPLVFRGFAWQGAASQSGMIGVATEADIWVDGIVGPRLRPVDPRTELSEELRTRPMTALAYRFVDQPFQLELRAEPTPPRLSVENRTTIVLGETSTQVESRLAARVARGRPLELQVFCPAGLEVASVGPTSSVASWRAEYAKPEEDGRLLTVRLTDPAREAGSFTLVLGGRSRPVVPGPASVPIFRPTGVDGPGVRVAVASRRGLTVEPLSGHGVGTVPDDDWTWPAGLDPALAASATFFATTPSPSAIAFEVSRRTRQPRTDSTSKVRVGSDHAEFDQEIVLNEDFEGARRLDVVFPKSQRGDWTVEVFGRPRTESVEIGSTSAEGVTRVEFSRPLGPSPRIRIRGQIDRPPGNPSPWSFPSPIAEVSDPGCPMTSISTCRLQLFADPVVSLDFDPSGWRREPDEASGEASPPANASFIGPREAAGASPVILATTRRRANVPGLVASRLWLTTDLTSEVPASTTARYRVVVHPGIFRFSLPAGARLIRATRGERAVDEVESLPTPANTGFDCRSRPERRSWSALNS